jgi:TonB-dependent SusC/RagA subfamily outer membrane receptor
MVFGTMISAFLNPQDIESFSILKDASSTRYYGIRAANGVVLISTKRGAKGKPVINYNGYAGWQSVTNQVKMANATEYATAINEFIHYNNITPPYSAIRQATEKAPIGMAWYCAMLL